MKQFRVILGLGLTVAVVGIAAAAYFNSSAAKTMSLNEWGDFFAGVSAPLALVWLMIGYFQHGEELRLNTEALRTQQMELKHQVEETARLAEAAKQQAEAAQQDLQDRQNREAREAKPDFVLDGGGSSANHVEIRLQNRGGEARDVSLHHDGTYQYTFPTMPYIESYGRATLDFMSRRDPEYPIRFTIKSTDRLRHEHNQEFEYSQAGLVRVTQ